MSNNTFPQHNMELIWLNDEVLYTFARRSNADACEELYRDMWKAKPTEWYTKEFSWADLDDVDWKALVDRCKDDS